MPIKNILILLSGCILACILILVLLFFLSSHNYIKAPLLKTTFTKQFQNNNSIVTPLPQPSGKCSQVFLPNNCEDVASSINICSEQHPNYPLLSDILTTSANPVLGMYSGVITNVNTDHYAITVASQKSGKSFTFSGVSLNGKMFDTHANHLYNIAFVPTEVKAIISFPCLQKSPYFIINRFQIVH